MTDKQARPATLTRLPKPAPDEQVDPVDSTPATPAPRERRKVASAKKTGYLEAAPRQREVVFPLSTRMAEEPTRVLEAEVLRSGKSVRAAVEHAIMLAYGQGGK